MKYNFLAILLIATFFISFVSADISSTSFQIEYYNNSIHVSNSEYAGNNQVFNLNNSYDNSTNSTIIPYSMFNYSFLFVENVTVGIDLVQKTLDAINETNVCNTNLLIQGNTCNISIQHTNDNANSLQTQIDTLKTDATNQQNLKWLLLAIGIGAGIVGTLFQQGKIGRGRKVKEGGSGEFSKTAGK